jgi:hypothetical protein
MTQEEIGKVKAMFAYCGVLDLWRENMTTEYVDRVFKVALSRNS